LARYASPPMGFWEQSGRRQKLPATRTLNPDDATTIPHLSLTPYLVSTLAVN
jgi:hypothetical protein